MQYLPIVTTLLSACIQPTHDAGYLQICSPSTKESVSRYLESNKRTHSKLLDIQHTKKTMTTLSGHSLSTDF